MEKRRATTNPEIFPEPETFLADANGIRLSCQDWGGEGTPNQHNPARDRVPGVGLPADRSCALETIGHVYSYDQRGHGDSSLPADGDYSWASTAADLKAFIVTMKLEGARGLGHSAGATAIGSLAARILS